MEAAMTVPVAVSTAGGDVILAGMLLIGFVLLAFSIYTRKGSGISRQPYGDLDHDSGPETLTPGASEEIMNMGRGTAGHHGERRPPAP